MNASIKEQGRWTMGGRSALATCERDVLRGGG